MGRGETIERRDENEFHVYEVLTKHGHQYQVFATEDAANRCASDMNEYPDYKYRNSLPFTVNPILVYRNY